MSAGPRVTQGRLAAPVDPDRDHVRGPEEAPVTLVEYGDFQCPHCAEAHDVVKEVLERAATPVRFVYRHFPIEHAHPQARLAAEATEAAAARGAFWRMHDHLFRHPDALSREELVAAAREMGLDADGVARDLDEGVYADRVERDFDSGVRSGVNGTPTFFVDGVRHDGSWEVEELLRAVEAVADGGAGGSQAATGSATAAADGGTGRAADGGTGRTPDAGARGGAEPSDRAAEAADRGPDAARDRRLHREPEPGSGEVRAVIDRSVSGAPAAGRAVRDIFSTDEIFQRVVATADEEFSRSNRLLFLSGLAAGLSIALSFLGTAALTAAVPGENARLIGNLMYPVGFLLVLLGRYQLYTENTLTPVTLVLTRIASLPSLLRVWGVVLTANLLGTAAAAYGFARTGIFSPATAEVARGFGEHALGMGWGDLFWKGVIAGWLVASIVWLNHAARDTVSRVFIVCSIVYLLVAADLAHCIVGACEVLYLVFEGGAGLGAFAWDFLVPVTLGNTAGGVLLVAILNFSQTENERIRDRDCSALRLPWREWCLGGETGRPDAR